MSAKIYSTLVLILFVTLPAFGHKGHKKTQTQPAATQTANTQTQAAPQSGQNVNHPALSESTAQRDMPTIMRESAMSHLHNKLIHFPLALGLTASILVFFSRRKPEMLPAIRILLVIAAIFSVAAYFTGKDQEEPFEEGEMHEFVELHEKVGIASGILLWSGVVLTSFRGVRNWLWIYGLFQFAFLSASGFLGGIIAHG